MAAEAFEEYFVDHCFQHSNQRRRGFLPETRFVLQVLEVGF